MTRTPAQITDWLDSNAHKLDLAVQYLGTEPNAERRPWDTASVRWLLTASWPYEAAAGNQSIPAVYKAIHDHDEWFLCDRFYLPATPGDLRQLEKNGLGCFGIETKHPMADFDVIGTSISYPVLTMSFLKMLTMSGITPRWKDRDANTAPMVMVGGLSYGTPEVLAPVVDCWFLGEVEDEPGNPGIGCVTARIRDFKAQGRWHTDRVSCYADLAREFNFLYFPRFIKLIYNYEDRATTAGHHSSKQVAGYVSELDGMRLPLRKRHVKNLDAVKPLDNPPLLYADPAMGSGDLEVARGCIGQDEFVFVRGQGLRKLSAFDEDVLHPKELLVAVEGRSGHYAVEHVLDNGERAVVRVRTDKGFGVTCTSDHPILTVQGWVEAGQLKHGDEIPIFYGQSAEGPPATLKASFTDINFQTDYRHDPERRQLGGSRVGNRASALIVPLRLSDDLAWLLGFLVGDGGIEKDGKSIFLMVHTSEPEVEDYVRQLMADIFGLVSPAVKTRPGVPVKYLYYYSSPLVRWLCGNFGFKPGKATESSKLFVPDAVLGSPLSMQQSFVRGLLEADATVNERTLVLSTVSERLAREVSLLLLNAGMPCSVTSRVRKSVKGFGGTDWGVRLIKASDSDRSWVTFVSHRKNNLTEKFRSNLVRQGSKFQRLNSGSFVSRVVDVQDVGTATVFDLHVPGPQSFDCSGLNVHNCPAWCSFCALSYRQKPYRQRSVPYVIDYAKKLQNNMGSTRMAPFSPDLPMYTQRRELIKQLLENVSDEVDAASMRVDDFNADDTFILLQVQGGLDAVTLGVEGNSQRMRDLIGKGTSDSDIKEAVTRGIRAGIRKFKLFMISNLPGEDEGDIYRILKLAKDLADIRDSMNQPTVRIQFSWTPLIIEGNTPMQWFAPQPSSRILGDVWEEFRDLKIDFKIGAKGEPNKAAFFQLCQRASRDVGEALVDAMLEVDQACWGGVPRTFKDLIESKLHAHGFKNGYGDCFDEREKADMFGWEFIDQGVSTELLWQAYVQMREFAEQTDSHTYDMNFDSSYHGSEWISRCDERCLGKTCGVCDYKDLRQRTGYLRAVDANVDVATIKPIDQHSQAVRIRVKIFKGIELRMVGNDHWRFLLRRALFRATDRLNPDWNVGIAKRSIRFASDEVKYRDWTYGTDYVEFSFTRPLTDDQIEAVIGEAHTHTNDRLNIGRWRRHPVNSVSIRHDVGNVLFSVEIDSSLEHAQQRLTWWSTQEHIDMRLKVEGGYFAPNSETVNARDYVHDLWLKPDGHRLLLRMLVKGRPNPYNIVAALMGKQSWLPYAKHPAERLEVFADTDPSQQDFLRPNCAACGLGIPITLLDEAYHHSLCPRCHDEERP